MKNKLVKIGIAAFACLIVFGSISLNKVITKKNDAIDRYYRTGISKTKAHISFAASFIDEYNLGGKVSLLLEASDELEDAGEYVQDYSIYYTYKSENKHYSGMQFPSFFRAYSRVAFEWSMAIINNDEEKLPSEDDIQQFKNDINRIAESFQIYSNHEYKDDYKIEELTHDQMNELIIELVKKMECEDVKEDLGSYWNEYII